MFYVYVDWTTEAKPRPFYVGKGQGPRLNDPVRSERHLAIIKEFGQLRRVHFESESESAALAEEARLIQELKTIHGVVGHFGANAVAYSGGSSGSSAFSSLQKHACVHVKLSQETHRDFRAQAFKQGTTMQLVMEASARAFAAGDERLLEIVRCELLRRR